VCPPCPNDSQGHETPPRRGILPGGVIAFRQRNAPQKRGHIWEPSSPAAADLPSPDTRRSCQRRGRGVSKGNHSTPSGRTLPLGIGKCCRGVSTNCFAKSFALATPRSQTSCSVPVLSTATVIVMNSFGFANSAQIVTRRLPRVLVPGWPSFAWGNLQGVPSWFLAFDSATIPVSKLRSVNNHCSPFRNRRGRSGRQHPGAPRGIQNIECDKPEIGRHNSTVA
jgi:hypothetical protein